MTDFSIIHYASSCDVDIPTMQVERGFKQSRISAMMISDPPPSNDFALTIDLFQSTVPNFQKLQALTH